MSFTKRIAAGLFLFAVLISPSYSFAQESAAPDIDGKRCSTSGRICPPIRATSIQAFIKELLEGVIKIGMPVIALAIIYSGFLFVSARGNSEAIKKAKDSLMYTLIGAAVLLGSWAIAKLISDTVLAL